MKRILYCSVFLTFFTVGSYAQLNEWVWLKGSTLVGDTGSHGTQGVPSPNNNPTSLYEAGQWTDANGKFWLYGGIEQNLNFSDDLWKYDPLTNEWTWMKGTNSTSPQAVYGTQGVPSPANKPASLGYGFATWTDLNNNLWLFGGTNGGILSDLWMYNISTNEWTWVKGPGTVNFAGAFGTQGVPDTANYPSARAETAIGWTDKNGDLWMFGGEGSGSFNDLWRYNIATNTWTWMKGTNLGFQFGKYGHRGQEDSLRTPGGRCVYSHWVDTLGNLWLFGGFDGSGGYFNDVWRYNMATNNWSWKGGTNVISGSGLRGPRCVADTNFVPTPRFENRACWRDTHGDLWTFGGGITPAFDSVWNDMWKYCIAQNQWIWIGGDTITNPAGNWGAQGTISAANKPNGRAGAPGWSDNNGHFYFFGGSSGLYPKMYNDLWRYNVDTTCGVCLAAALPVANFTSSDTAFCNESGKCINFFDHSTNFPSTWKWYFPGAIPDSSTLQNPDSICYYAPGTYPVTLIVTNAVGTDTLNVSPMIIFGTTPPQPTITQSHDTLFSSHSSYYQWYFNGSPIAGATDSFYVETTSGTYAVQITDNNGCVSLSGGFVITSVNELAITNSGFLIYPNPASQSVVISWQSSVKGNIEITIVNVLGEKVYSLQLNTANYGLRTEIDVSSFAAGVYFIKITDETKNYVGKFVKE